MPTRRKAGDLHRVGAPLDLDDGTDPDNPVRLYIKKPSRPVHQEMIRKAGAAKAIMLSAGRDRNGEEYLSVLADAYDWPLEQMVDVLIATDAQHAIESAEAQLEFEEGSEWAKDGYLQGLKDAWDGSDDVPGLKFRHAEDESDPEAVRVLEELKRFEAQVQARVAPEHDRLRRETAARPDEELRHELTKFLLDARSDAVWQFEYHSMAILRCTFDRDETGRPTLKHFESIDEVYELDDAVRMQFIFKIDALSVGVTEGKGLRQAGTSSEPSPTPGPQETVPTSGPRSAAP